MGFLRGFLAVLLLLNYVAARPPATEVQTNNHHDDHHPPLQSGTHSSLHEVETEEGAPDEGDGSLNKEVVFETNQDEELETEEPVEEEPIEDEDILAEKRGGSQRRTHSNRRNHTVIQKRGDRSSEEDKLELLNPDHVNHKRSPHNEDCLHEIRKRSSGQGSHEEEDDGSFDGLEYEDFEKESGNKEKRSYPHHEQEEVTEAEELSNFPSDSAQHVQSVALRVKRVSKAGSSHRNRLLTKNKGNSKAGQGEEEQPPVMIEPIM